MSDKFNFFDIMKEIEKTKPQIEAAKEKAEKIKATGTAGGDMVSVTINGKDEAEKVVISQEAYDLGKEALEVLLCAAITQAAANLNAERQSSLMDSFKAFRPVM